MRKAGTQTFCNFWIPAFAGMTKHNKRSVFYCRINKDAFLGELDFRMPAQFSL